MPIAISFRYVRFLRDKGGVYWIERFFYFVKKILFISNVNLYGFLFSYLSRDDICLLYLTLSLHKLPTSTPQYVCPPSQSTTVIPIHYIPFG